MEELINAIDPSTDEMELNFLITNDTVSSFRGQVVTWLRQPTGWPNLIY